MDAKGLVYLWPAQTQPTFSMHTIALVQKGTETEVSSSELSTWHVLGEQNLLGHVVQPSTSSRGKTGLP